VPSIPAPFIIHNFTPRQEVAIATCQPPHEGGDRDISTAHFGYNRGDEQGVFALRSVINWDKPFGGGRGGGGK
jgi:hypothetical protein